MGDGDDDPLADLDGAGSCQLEVLANLRIGTAAVAKAEALAGHLNRQQQVFI